MKIELQQTCGSCPEQYDVFFGGKAIGYLRLRNGFFCAEHNEETVYSAHTIGDGSFDCEERSYHLDMAIKAIEKSMTK